jgi:hypothetical protein
MRRVLAILLVVLVAAGCGVRPSGVITGVEAPSGPAEGEVPPGSPALSPTSSLALFFVSGDRVASVPRHLVHEDLVGMLADGPDPDERAQGLSTEVPKAAAPATVTASGSGMDVALATDVDGLTRFAVDQIVCTLLAQHPGTMTATLRGGGHTTEQRTCPVGR